MDSSAFSASLQKALTLHQTGRLDEARSIYEALLKQNPTHPDTSNLAGLLAFEEGDFERAVELIKQATVQSPNNSQFRNNLGSVYASQAKTDLAIGCFQSAIAIDPVYILAYENLGNALMELGRTQEAIKHYQKVVSLEPNNEGGYIHLATALNANGQSDKAIFSLQKILAEGVEFPTAYNNLGVLLSESGQVTEAIDCFNQAAKIQPDYAAAFANLATALWEKKFLEEAKQNARRALEIDSSLQESYTALGLIFHAQGRVTEASEYILEPSLNFRATDHDQDLSLEAFDQINKYKIQHDVEQISYLIDQGLFKNDDSHVLDDYKSLSQLVPKDGTPILLSEISLSPSLKFSRSYNRLNNFYTAPVLKGGALNPSLDTASIEEAYHSNPPGFSLVDHFLSDEALNELRRFCFESTIWYDLSAVGDLGASLEEGFCCPLLLQIAHEIRERFPSIYGEHYFSTCWSYRYYAKKSGDGLHGDSGRVSVNIWLTPDEANLEPNRGGLLFWNKKVPMLKVKDNPKEMTDQIMRDIIAEPDATSFAVPYKCNRATLFNSNIIHKTDEINFKPGFLNRRLNITFVFGKPEY